MPPRAAPRRSSSTACGVAGGDEAAPDRQQVRDEADREAERLLDLGLRAGARPTLYGVDVLEHGAGVGARLQRAPGARDAGLRVDDDARRVERPASGSSARSAAVA